MVAWVLTVSPRSVLQLMAEASFLCDVPETGMPQKGSTTVSDTGLYPWVIGRRKHGSWQAIVERSKLNENYAPRLNMLPPPPPSITTFFKLTYKSNRYFGGEKKSYKLTILSPFSWESLDVWWSSGLTPSLKLSGPGNFMPPSSRDYFRKPRR